MLKYIEEFGKHVVIAGFRNVRIPNIEGFLEKIRTHLGEDVEVQFFDARFVATWQHLYFASLNALKAFKNKENISKSLAMETMLYASTQRQIRKAMKLIGITPNSLELAVLLIGDDANSVNQALYLMAKLLNAERDDSVINISEDKIGAIRAAFEISDVEIESILDGNDLEKAIVDVIIERMALLAIKR